MNKEKTERLLNMQENIKINYKDKDGNPVEKQIRNNIFRPVSDSTMFQKRFKIIHGFVKEKLIHTGIKIIDWLFGKYLIQSLEDIPEENCNNMQRILYHSYLVGLEHTFKRVHHDWHIKAGTDLKIKDRHNHWLFWKEKHRSFKSRLMLLNLYMTEVLEDTFDRAVVDLSMIEMYHQIHSLYDGKVPSLDEFRVYDSHEGRDIQYFVDTINVPTWEIVNKNE